MSKEPSELKAIVKRFPGLISKKKSLEPLLKFLEAGFKEDDLEQLFSKPNLDTDTILNSIERH